MRLSTICLSLAVFGLGVVLAGQTTLPADAPVTLPDDAPVDHAAEPTSELNGANETAAAARASLSFASPARGLVRPSQQVTLRSPLNEQLDQLHVEEGDHVEEGQLLVELDSRQQAMVVKAARFEAESEARLRKAQLMVEEAVFSLEQVEGLAAKDVAGEWEVRRARLQKRQAEADHELARERAEQAQLQYELEQAKLRRYTIEAPFAGVIHHIQAEPGTLLSGDQEILRLISLNPLHAVVYVPVHAYGDLREGGRYRFRAGAPVDEQLTGELITIDPVLDPASQSFRCVFEIANPDIALPAGFTVELTGLADDS